MKVNFYSFLVLLLIFKSCSSAKEQNHLDSDNFDTAKARIACLEQEIIVHSPLQQVEFELFNINGFSDNPTRIPGPSYWNYKLALKVSSSAIDQWTTGMVTRTKLEENLDWMDKIVEQRKEEWSRSSTPEFFAREGEAIYLVVHRKEGIIFKSIMVD